MIGQLVPLALNNCRQSANGAKATRATSARTATWCNETAGGVHALVKFMSRVKFIIYSVNTLGSLITITIEIESYFISYESPTVTRTTIQERKSIT